MASDRYLPRVGDAELLRRLEAAGAVLIEGPRACGKTAMARQVAASEVLLDIDANARRAMAVDPGLVLAEDRPRLIDEWQTEPAIWNHVRHAVDRHVARGGRRGQFILTGSAVPADDITRHTGAGRISRLRLRPMTLMEAGVSTGHISMGGMLRGRFDGCPDSRMPLPEIAAQICRGGWPGDIGRSDAVCLTARTDYLEEIRRGDIERLDGVRRDPENVGRLLRSLARNVATTVSARAIAADAGGGDGPLDSDTVRGYLNALRRLLVYEEQPVWAPHLRSRSRLRQAPKRHFADPSLATVALGATPERLLADLELLGVLFESLVHRDLRVYSQAHDASVHHYRDNTGLEVDMVVEDRSGAWCAFEVKLGVGQVDNAAQTLLKFRDRLDLEKVGEPGTLGVIVSSGYGYMRGDGIAVIPVTAMGP